MFFENMLYPFVKLGLVKVTDIDENDFKALTRLNLFLENWI